MYIDQHLHWGPQINHINNKLAKNIGIITKLRCYVNLHTMKQLYCSFIYPYLTYAITSWGSAYKTRLNRIMTKQVNTFVQFFLHTVGRMLRLTVIYWVSSNLITFSNLIEAVKVALFAHKSINGPTGIPTIFSGTLPIASDCYRS